ncbi:cytoskeleton protein RodZ [Vibrio porteresiae]|uniref:Cytoskeleton protein RodZ n=1 Tax=Vibrio porteresiae DSM 19223 TaxID=1123496 RepID=A0ABZ0QDD0_9VIBR|nr:cytoskeleton protein RodZ [Vibrio porteresiae]WPC73531.1 cytoskeleton protein RodZ [Vibrio porteresiae DSM 19223]
MNTEQQDDIQMECNTLQPGTLLKNKREELGLSQKQIAARLRLKETIIISIENNEFDSEQVATFTRGYLRSYAKAVGITDKEILESYKEHCSVVPQEQPMQSFSKKTKREQHDHRIMVLTWGILIVLIGMSSLWWWQNSHQDTLTPQAPKPTVQAEPASPVDEKTAAEQTKDDDFATVSSLSQQQEATDAEPESAEDDVPPAEVDTPEDEAPAAPVAPAKPTSPTQTKVAPKVQAPVETAQTPAPVLISNPGEMTMVFTADCWIQVTDANGKTLATGVKKEGQSLNLHGDKPFKVVLGAPEAVQMTFASEPVDLSRYTSGKVARLTLP